MNISKQDKQNIPIDFRLIIDLVKENSRVLDVGCNDGKLLSLLKKYKNVAARGVEISQQRVNICVANGLSVVQGDADIDLIDYPDNAFDYVILSKTIQATHRPKHVMEQLIRIGKKVIVSFPNFGYWQVRSSLAFKGRMPVTKNLPVSWYETSNIHFCTIKDFLELCTSLGIVVLKQFAINPSRNKIRPVRFVNFTNIFADQALFLLTKE